MAIIKYEHFGKEVYVRENLRGQHRKHCLCFMCAKFFPKAPQNCPIAQATYENCIKFNTVTPMWECPMFQKKGADDE